MPVIGGAFYVRNLASADSLIGIVPRGLAQRNKGRKTSYFDVSGRPACGGKPREAQGCAETPATTLSGRLGTGVDSFATENSAGRGLKDTA